MPGELSAASRSMDELYVLLEEHVAARQALVQIRRVAETDPQPDERIHCWLAAQVEQVSVLLNQFHRPKEEAVLLPHFEHKGLGNGPALLRALDEERALVAQLSEVCGRLRASATSLAAHIELAPLAGELLKLLDYREQVLYPAFYGACDEEDLWRVSVELDRAVDIGGRREREHIITKSASAPPP